ncbi:MAG: hypothetical protein J5I53_04125 [Bradyrhizobiaceae bacterium]|nr:hypothetical protein [Bradyrhizobiaceae bacterium]
MNHSKLVNGLYAALAVCGMLLLPPRAMCQVSLSGQYVGRGEFRSGYGSPISKDAAPAIFLGQRVRFQARYSTGSVNVFASVQDVRIWGATPQQNTSDENLSVHEAWFTIPLIDSLSLKAGRMELNYDNRRFFGSGDWSLQARSHELLLFRYESNTFKAHVGGAYNVSNESLTEQAFTTKSQYRTGTLVWLNNHSRIHNISALYWGNGVEHNDAVDSATMRRTIRYMHTVGLSNLSMSLGSFTPQLFAYYQFGVGEGLLPVSAYNVGVQCSWKVQTGQHSQLHASIGSELISGNNMTDNSEQRAYSPLFGTNHAHNGYMDMFYVGGRHERSVGLVDAFIRLHQTIDSSLFVAASVHGFQSQVNIVNNNGSRAQYLGTEVDLTAGVKLGGGVSVQVGASAIVPTAEFTALRNVVSPADVCTWGYVMIIVRPFENAPFIGLMR